MYGERLNQLDLRASKTLRRGSNKLALNFDVYNALNVSQVQQENPNYASFRVPQVIEPARFAKISMQFDF